MASGSTSSLTFAVGDIHGCLDKLERVVAACDAYAAGRPARFVFVGDYIDRGPDSRGVVAFLMRMQQAAPTTDAGKALVGQLREDAIEGASVNPYLLSPRLDQWFR